MTKSYCIAWIDHVLQCWNQLFHQLIDICVVSPLGFLRIMLLGTFAYIVFVWTCIFSSLGDTLRSGMAKSYGASMFSILRNRQTVFQNLQACTWDVAIHVLRIPIPCVFTESQLIGQVKHRWWMWRKELQNLHIPAAILGTDSEIMRGSSVLDGDTEDAGLR